MIVNNNFRLFSALRIWTPAKTRSRRWHSWVYWGWHKERVEKGYKVGKFVLLTECFLYNLLFFFSLFHRDTNCANYWFYFADMFLLQTERRLNWLRQKILQKIIPFGLRIKSQLFESILWEVQILLSFASSNWTLNNPQRKWIV